MAKTTPASLKDRVIEEIRGKVDEYEGGMGAFMSSIREYDDLFRVKKPARRANTFSNPRLTEFSRATIALGTLMYRMMTAKDPFFTTIPMDFMGDPFDQLAGMVNYERGQTVQHAMMAQLRSAKYRQQLLKANMYCLPFGTVFCQEDYRVIGVNSRGRRVPVTDFIPRVMDQVAFDRGTERIDDADWVSTMDVASNATLQRLIAEVALVNAPWNKAALQEAIDLNEKSNTINPYVLSRLRRSGINDDDALSRRKELLMYYGKLDCLNDGLEYVCALVNRKVMVRFHANNFQHGKRPFRVAKWIDWAGPLGIGLGQGIGGLHKSMDANRQKVQDNVAFAAYNIWKRKKGSVSDDDLAIRPFGFVDVDDHNDLTALNPSTQGAEAGLKLEDLMKQEIKAWSGATDTLQAIVTDATASEVALAQNEALRRVSVAAEMAAESLVREHLEVCHSNNGEYIKAPFNINRAGVVQAVYPEDFNMDADFELLMTVDKDYKPQRLQKLIETLQIVTSTKSNHPELQGIPIKPILNQIMYMLDVPAKDLMPGAMGGMGGMMSAPFAPPPIDPAMMASLGAGAPPAGTEMLQTPVGNVLGSA